MAEATSAGPKWAIGIALVICAGGFVWFGLSESPDEPAPVRASQSDPVVGGSAPAESAPAPAESSPAPADDSETSSVRIAEHGRLTLRRSDIPTGEPFPLTLGLPDEARGTGPTSARIVSTDGRRLDLTGRPLPGAGSGIELAIDPAFLLQGRYMIELRTDSKHPLALQRYVLEIR
jgi:hypothetical protein